jgi:hypothetical protein
MESPGVKSQGFLVVVKKDGTVRANSPQYAQQDFRRSRPGLPH